MDRPLLILAVVTMVLYLFNLRGMMGWRRQVYQGLTLVIDFVFIFDLVLKLRTYGRQYIRTPWFLIDFLSCLPVLDVLASSLLSFHAIRFIRGFRILRILRGLRVLRALRAIPAFDRLMNEASASESTRRFHRAMNLAMISLTILVLSIIVMVRREREHQFLERITAASRENTSVSHIRELGGRFTTRDVNDVDVITRSMMVDGARRTVYFNLDLVDEEANEIEFFLILGMMFTMLFFLYIMAYHQLDVSQSQLRALLNLALPQQVAERFVSDPNAYHQKSRSSAAIMFMDFVGFTRTSELLAHDPDTIAVHLEAAMDRLVSELSKHDMIIDKFIGDAIMTFRGGPLVNGTLADHAYRSVRAALDSTRALSDLNDAFFKRVKIGGVTAHNCLIGAFGTSARLSYTILGDGVNLAARLEPASEQCGTRNLFCELTHQLCAARPDLVWRRWGKIRVAGKTDPVEVYEAFDADELHDHDFDFLASFQRGLEAFEHNDVDRARDLFLMADHQRPGGDPPSRFYVAWCEKRMLVGTPVGWEPVYDTHK